MVGKDLVKHVTCKKIYEWEEKGTKAEIKEGEKSTLGGQLDLFQKPEKAYYRTFHVVVYDCGVKYNIIRKLVNCGCKVTVVPANTKADDVLAMKPDGILLSNGPGDPEAVSYMVENTRQLLGKKPVFGICLGHQIMGLSLGYTTYKLKFGHNGANQPVMDLNTRKVEITAQNHGFAVDMNSIPDKDVILTHINLYDKTVEGLRHKKLPIFSVQYHPEASPGPHDSHYLFKRFIEMMKKAGARD